MPEASFERVLIAELEDLRAGRVDDALDESNVLQEADAQDLVGMAFSGGGIRSATFNLGIMQGLAKLGLLPRFDYLSTVSGGGYIGTWLQAWLHHARRTCDEEPISFVQDRLAGRAEPSEVRFLREYSNYLTPRIGLLSGDTWTLASIYLRNLLLNLVVTSSAVASFLLLLRTLHCAFGVLSAHPRLALGIAVCALLIAVSAASANLRSEFKVKLGDSPPYIATPAAVLLLVIVPILVATWSVGAYACVRPSWRAGGPVSLYSLGFALVYVFSTSLPALSRWHAKGPALREGKRRGRRWDLVWVGCATLLAALLASVFFWLFGAMLTRYGQSGPSAERWGPLYGPPILTMGIGIVMAMHVGIAGNSLSEQLREWQARIAALLIGSAALIGLSCMIANISLADAEQLSSLVIPAWVGTTAASLWAGRSEGSLSPVLSILRRALIRVGPYVFVAGFLIAIGIGTDLIVSRLLASQSVEWRALISLGLAGIALLIAALLSLRFGINDFAIGALYRNRLVRCYLGAVRAEVRNPNLLTGFAEEDDLLNVADLDAPQGTTRKEIFANRACRPYAIYNATLNLVGGDKLAWQQRRARPFVFTPKYCGFALSPWDRDLIPGRTGKVCAFRPSREYATGVSLGTAMSISGAAVSSSMGERSTPVLSFLLTIFNLRLGRWLPNPKHSTIWRVDGPRFGLGLLIKELLGMTGDEQRYVYLSDGGHFENLGLFELVRRRCRFIVVSDAGQDASHTFADFGNAIERVRTDLGVEIEIDLAPLQLDEKTRRSRARCAVGTVRYDESTSGVLVYLKATLTGSEPTDIARYARQKPLFPHETTADQWFDESQFESYRRLGEQTAMEIFAAVGDRVELAKLSTEKLFLGVMQRWRMRVCVEGGFARHAEELSRISRSIRLDARLNFLALQIFPDLWDVELLTHAGPDEKHFALPEDIDALRAGFYVSHEMIQLMENVYLDLELETQFEHPDNRGWMTLFQRWAWCSMFRVSWAICAGTFGARFQTFIERRFGLGCARIKVRSALSSVSLEKHDGHLRRKFGLNFFEVALLRLFNRSQPAPFEILPLASLIDSPASGIAGGQTTIELSCGFAAVRDKKLILFRVQDHVRKMGIARRGLEVLIREGHIDQAPAFKPFALVGNETVTQEDIDAFLRLFNSVVRDLEASASPPR